MLRVLFHKLAAVRIVGYYARSNDSYLSYGTAVAWPYVDFCNAQQCVCTRTRFTRGEKVLRREYLNTRARTYAKKITIFVTNYYYIL